MPASHSDLYDNQPSTDEARTALPFPPITKQHIINCSYQNWYSKYKGFAYSAYPVQLSETFILYLLDGGFVLPPDNVSPLTSPSSSSLKDDSDSRDQDDEEDDKVRGGEGAEDRDQAGEHERAKSRDPAEEHDQAAESEVTDQDEDDDKNKPFHGMPGFNNLYEYLQTYHEEERPALCGPSRARDHLREYSPWMIDVTTPTSDSSELSELPDPSIYWRGVHYCIENAIKKCGGVALPKLNWSAPKDATHMNLVNSMECRTPNDVYLLLKSSNFVTHDLTHCFKGCVDEAQRFTGTDMNELTYHLILRKFEHIVPSMEFRIFVCGRTILGISQRDARCHYDFLFPMVPNLKRCLIRFFEKHVRGTFRDENFTMDVYVEEPHNNTKCVKIIDFNPWAPRTDPLLFSWLELLTMEKPAYQEDEDEDHSMTYDDGNRSDDAEDYYPDVELRLIKETDPEAWNMSTPAYSAHKLPREVVDATQAGDGGQGMSELLEQWRDLGKGPGQEE
ncbi:MAG: hypothetical protein M1831_004625 [Alyxoria varia]|nr:MAG: hypothetical protein M1831_004625 [Alyxoria varia]